MSKNFSQTTELCDRILSKEFMKKDQLEYQPSKTQLLDYYTELLQVFNAEILQEFNKTLICHGVGVQTLKNIYEASNQLTKEKLSQIDQTFEETYLSNQKLTTAQIAKLWQFKTYLKIKIKENRLKSLKNSRNVLIHNWIVSGPFSYLHYIDLELKQWVKQFKKQNLKTLKNREEYSELKSSCLELSEEELKIAILKMNLDELYSVLKFIQDQWFIRFWRKEAILHGMYQMIDRKKYILFQMKLSLEDEICQRACFELFHFKMRPEEEWTGQKQIKTYKKIQKQPFLVGSLNLNTYKILLKNSTMELKQKLKTQLQENFDKSVKTYNFKHKESNPTQKNKKQNCNVFGQLISGDYEINQEQLSYLSKKFNPMRKQWQKDKLVQQVRQLKGTIDTHVFIRYRNHIVKTLIELSTKRK